MSGPEVDIGGNDTSSHTPKQHAETMAPKQISSSNVPPVLSENEDLLQVEVPVDRAPSPSGSSSWFSRLRNSMSPGPKIPEVSLDVQLPQELGLGELKALDLLPSLPDIPLVNNENKTICEEIKSKVKLDRLSLREVERMYIEEKTKEKTIAKLIAQHKQKEELIAQLDLQKATVWQNDLGENVAVIGGYNNNGALQVILRAGRYKIDQKYSKPAVVFAGEQTMAYIDKNFDVNPSGKVCAIVDFRGFLPTPAHLPFALWLLQSGVADLYNARIDAIYVYESPLIVESFWKLFRTMVPKELADFITFIDRERIKDHFDLDQISTDMGGEKPLDSFITVQKLAIAQIPKKDSPEKDSAERDSPEEDSAKKDAAERDSPEEDSAKKDSTKRAASEEAESPPPEKKISLTVESPKEGEPAKPIQDDLGVD